MTRVNWIFLTIRTHCRLGLVEHSGQYGGVMLSLVLSFGESVNRNRFEQFLLSGICSTLTTASGDQSMMRRHLLLFV